MSDPLVDQKTIDDLMAQREAARKIARRTVEDVEAAVATVTRATEALETARSERDAAWDRLRGITSALNTLGVRHMGQMLYDAEDDDE